MARIFHVKLVAIELAPPVALLRIVAEIVEDQGAEAVLLAGTDLALAFNGFSPDFAVFDCAEAHVEAIAAAAIAL